MSGMMWTEEGRKGGREEESNAVEDGANVGGASERRSRRKTCRGRDVCISENGESGGGIANGLVCCNG